MEGCLQLPLCLALASLLILCTVVQAGAVMSSSLAKYWDHELPGVAMPEALEKLSSPLTPSSTRASLERLKAGSLRLSSDQYCSSTKASCLKSEDILGIQPRVCIPPFFRYEYGIIPCEVSASAVAQVAASGIFFLPSSMKHGSSLLIPDTANDLSGVTFLPDSLAQALPFDSQHLVELSKVYGVSDDSNMHLQMEYTLAHCAFKSEHEVSSCSTSGEGMVRFVSTVAGQNVVVLSPTQLSKQEAIVKDVQLLTGKGDKVVSCHNMKFPSLVYSCHMTQTSQVLDISLQLANGKSAHGLALCHLDTSYWNPTHMAFDALKTKPGRSSVCHWLPENTFVYFPHKGM